MTRDPGSAAALVSDLCAWIDRLFPDADRAERLKRALGERFGEDARAVTAEVCREVEAVAHGFSRHFALEYVADGSLVPDTEPPGWPPQDPRDVQLRAGSAGEVTRRPDGVGVLVLDGLTACTSPRRTWRPRSRCCAAPGASCWTCGATAAEIREP